MSVSVDQQPVECSVSIPRRGSLPGIPNPTCREGGRSPKPAAAGPKSPPFCCLLKPYVFIPQPLNYSAQNQKIGLTFSLCLIY